MSALGPTKNEQVYSHRDLAWPLGRQRLQSALPHDLQQQIIQSVLARPQAQALDPRDLSYDFWVAKSIRYLDINFVPSKYRAQKFSQIEYLFRHHPDSKWLWRDDPITELVRPLVENFKDLFLHMTRVKVHLQKPNTRVPLHRDLSAGYVYDLENPLSTHSGPHHMKFQMYPWVDLADFGGGVQKKLKGLTQWSLKIPLTTVPGQYGRQTIFDQKPHFYTTQGNLYLLNENNWHGVDLVSHVRGLVFIDGIMAPHQIQSFFPAAIPIFDQRGASTP